MVELKNSVQKEINYRNVYVAENLMESALIFKVEDHVVVPPSIIDTKSCYNFLAHAIHMLARI